MVLCHSGINKALLLKMKAFSFIRHNGLLSSSLMYSREYSFVVHYILGACLSFPLFVCCLGSKYYEREALMHDSVFGPILAALLGE